MTQNLIEQTRDWILSVCNPHSLLVFGSAARGEMNIASDLDIALIFEDEESLMENRRKLYESLKEHEPVWPRDLLFFTLSGFRNRLVTGGIAEIIREEGRLIHGSMP